MPQQESKYVIPMGHSYRARALQQEANKRASSSNVQRKKQDMPTGQAEEYTPSNNKLSW